MSRGARRCRSGAIAAVLACCAVAGCSPSGDTGNATPDCGYSLTWQQRIYLDLVYVLHPPQTRANIRVPAAGARPGRGFIPQCPGDSEGSPATVYAVRGVSPQIAVLARADNHRDLPLVLLIRQGRAIPVSLLRRP